MKMQMQNKANMIERLNAGTAAEIVRNLSRKKVIRKERLMLHSEITIMRIVVMVLH